MTIISSREFVTHQGKYFNMAIHEDVCIKRGQNMFQLICKPVVEEQIVLQPDDDLRRAITGDELLKRIYDDIDKKFANRITR